MSTKTTFKRVALVAVASLGFGVLGVIPSSAATTDEITTTQLTSVAAATGVTALSTTPTVGIGTTISAVLASVLHTDVSTVSLVASVTSKPVGAQASVAWTTDTATVVGGSDPRVTMGIYTQVLANEIDDVGLLLSKAAGY